MTILTKSHDAASNVAFDDLEVIIISDDDTDDSNDEYEFEDVLVIDATASLADDDPNDDEGTNDTATTNVQVHTDADVPTSEVGHVWEMGDERVTPDVTPRDDTIEGPESVFCDDGDDDSAVHLDYNGVDAGTSTTVLKVENTVRGLAVEVAALRSRLAEVEAQLRLGPVACQLTKLSRKRKRSAPISRSRAKVSRTINISATRAYVY
ncbi:hypothetical protein QQZ08_012471 [Neonectria magnoliae]|uniref:Uncharacterized protein n=1 Tax=Neonectria magnoliae TaxID=2732573 RepID=A0ABR1H2R8_9HYPO